MINLKISKNIDERMLITINLINRGYNEFLNIATFLI